MTPPSLRPWGALAEPGVLTRLVWRVLYSYLFLPNMQIWAYVILTSVGHLAGICQLRLANHGYHILRMEIKLFFVVVVF